MRFSTWLAFLPDRVRYWVMTHRWHRCIRCGGVKWFTLMGSRVLGGGLICKACDQLPIGARHAAALEAFARWDVPKPGQVQAAPDGEAQWETNRQVSTAPEVSGVWVPGQVSHWEPDGGQVVGLKQATAKVIGNTLADLDGGPFALPPDGGPY